MGKTKWVVTSWGEREERETEAQAMELAGDWLEGDREQARQGQEWPEFVGASVWRMELVAETVEREEIAGMLETWVDYALERCEPRSSDSGRLDFGHLPMWSDWDAKDPEQGGGTVYLRTTDAHTGEPTTISASVSGGGVRAIRDLAVSMWAHEVDEGLRLDGERLRDPHAPPDGRCFECGLDDHGDREHREGGE